MFGRQWMIDGLAEEVEDFMHERGKSRKESKVSLRKSDRILRRDWK